VLSVLGADPAVVGAAGDRLHLPLEGRLPGFAEALDLAVSVRVAVDDRLEAPVIRALATQNDAAGADDELGVEHGPAARTDRLRAAEHRYRATYPLGPGVDLAYGLSMSLPPGPALPPALQTVTWLFRPIEFMNGCRRRHGDAFSVKFVGFQTPMVMVSDPDAIAALYKSRENGLPPGRTVALQPVMGPRSVLLLEGQEHLARRKLMVPAFHGERMRAFGPLVEEIIGREIDSWPLERSFAIHPRMQAVTLEVILRAVFGVSDEDRLSRLRTLLSGLLRESSSPVLQLRVLIGRRLGRAGPLEDIRRRNDEVNEVLAAEIAERRADPGLNTRTDILSQLVASRFEDGSSMDDAELRDQLMTLLLAGHETTATALGWTFDLLLRNPPALARLRDEIDAEGDEYLRAVITESLRLRPVIPLAGRRLHADLPVNGYTLPVGTDVTPAIWLTHTRPDLYPDPLAFRPERFLEDPPKTYGWIPFGGGVRRCLGAAFAEFEMRVVLREVLGRCELRLARHAPERIARRNITFSPRHGTPVMVTRRLPQAT
jgi:cytochrome P450